MPIERTCGHWMGDRGRHCGADKTRRFLVGFRCAEHSPARVAGLEDTWLSAPGGGAPR